MDNQEKNYTLEELISSLYDFEGYSEEEKQQTISETTSMISEAAILRGLEEAGEASQQAFNDLMDQNPDDQAVAEFIKQHLPNFDKHVAEEIVIFGEMGAETQEPLQAGEEK